MNTVPTHDLKCMEIWGGHRSIESHTASRGLDAWIFSQPYQGETNGGDVHYFALCVGGIVTRLVLADVSGHGSAVAETSQTLKGLLRRFMNAKRQEKLMSELNQEFTAMEKHSRFASAVVVTYLSNKRRLLISNAGHPQPLLYSTTTKSWRLVSEENVARPNPQAAMKDPDNLPLGIMDSAAYSAIEMKVADGDMLVLYTDGLSELMTEESEMMGQDGLLEVAKSISVTPESSCDEFGKSFIRALHRDEAIARNDDVSLIVLRFGQGRPAPGLGERLQAFRSLLLGR